METLLNCLCRRIHTEYCMLCFSVPGYLLPGEEGGEGKVVHSRRGRMALRGAHMEEGQDLFPNLTGLSVRPEGSFKSSGSSSDSMAAGYSGPPEGRETISQPGSHPSHPSSIYNILTCWV